MDSPQVAAVQNLLSLSDILAVTRQQRYHALWMFVDKLLPAITTGLAKLPASAEMTNELPLSLFAVACLLLALQLDETASSLNDSKQLAEDVHKTACSALGESFSASHSSSRLLEAAAMVQVEMAAAATIRQLTSDHLLDMHCKIQEAGLAAFQGVALDTCYNVLELLYASADYRRSQPLECGGKLLAAAIIAAAFAITVQPARVSTLPFLSWLSDLSKHPKEVIQAQSAQVITYLLQ